MKPAIKADFLKKVRGHVSNGIVTRDYSIRIDKIKSIKLDGIDPSDAMPVYEWKGTPVGCLLQDVDKRRPDAVFDRSDKKCFRKVADAFGYPPAIAVLQDALVLEAHEADVGAVHVEMAEAIADVDDTDWPAMPHLIIAAVFDYTVDKIDPGKTMKAARLRAKRAAELHRAAAAATIVSDDDWSRLHDDALSSMEKADKTYGHKESAEGFVCRAAMRCTLRTMETLSGTVRQLVKAIAKADHEAGGEGAFELAYTEVRTVVLTQLRHRK